MIRHPIVSGKEVIGNAGNRTVYNPHGGSVVGIVSYADSEQVLQALNGSHKTFSTLKITKEDRAGILREASKLLARRKELVARTITLEAGKPITYSNGEVDRAVFTLSAGAEWALHSDDDISPDLLAAPNAIGKIVSYRYFPVGVVTAITPFNFPLNLVVHKLAPAIAAGNTIVLKPAPQTPLTSFLLADVLFESGLPKEWLAVVPCDNDAAEQLVAHEIPKVVSFTGSAKVGWHLKEIAPNKKVTLELGGNGPIIIDDLHGKDIDAVVKSLIVAGFSYAGQICISLQNLYIKRNIFDAVMTKFVSAAGNAVAGDPMNKETLVGSMISIQAAQRAWSWVEDAVQNGAEKLCGEYDGNSIITPTVLVNVPTTCPVTCEEVFAPVVVAKAYDSLSDVIDELNSSRYGLQAGIYSSDAAVINQVYTTLNTGGVIANDINTFRIDTMPYGGVKDSGFGREGIEFAMKEMMEIKVLVQRD